jgi:hypothetical protein
VPVFILAAIFASVADQSHLKPANGFQNFITGIAVNEAIENKTAAVQGKNMGACLTGRHTSPEACGREKELIGAGGCPEGKSIILIPF